MKESDRLEKYRQIKELYDRGLKQYEIVKQLHTSTRLFAECLTYYGIKRLSKAEKKAKIIELYKLGNSLHSITKELNVTHRTAKKAIAGVPKPVKQRSPSLGLLLGVHK